MNKILITNAVPSNNGDAALVFSLYNSLTQKGFDVKIACQRYGLIKEIYADYPLVPELGESKILKFPFNKYVKPFLVPIMFLFNRAFMSSDLLISAPGGYMNSYYGFKKVMATLIFAKLIGKKTAIYAQSFGPLNDRDKKRLKRLSRYVDVMLARDVFSYNILKEVGVPKAKFKLIEDGAFLIPFKTKRAQSKKVAISVRSWSFDGRSESHFIEMIKQMAEHLLKVGYSIEFISTCQGLEGYRDDSIIAERIASQLNDRNNVYVNKKFYRLDEFQDHLGEFQLVIGTRLHMCIMSMLSGIPSLNISYEIKGKEVYEYLGLKDYSIDYNEDFNNSLLVLKKMLQHQEDLAKDIELKMVNQNSKALKYLDEFLNKLK